jgi:dephospho-CoA kinase
VWITGVSGTGKSTVRLELAGRGFRSFDTDEDGIAAWHLRTTGEAIHDSDAGNRPDGFLRHRWAINRSRVEELALMARDQLVFLCGAVENEDEVWDLFDVVVCLVLDEATLRARLATRTTNRFGRTRVELNAILSRNRTTEATYRGVGAFVVSAAQPVAVVADQILELAGAELPGSRGG